MSAKIQSAVLYAYDPSLPAPTGRVLARYTPVPCPGFGPLLVRAETLKADDVEALDAAEPLAEEIVLNSVLLTPASF